MAAPSSADSLTRTVRVRPISRQADRVLGPALLLGMGLLRRARPLPRMPARIGFCVLGAIGDAMVASAVMHDVRRAFPAADITLIASSTNHMIAPLLPAIDTVLVLPLHRPHRAWRLIRAAKFDLIIDANQWIRLSAVLAAASGSCTIGFRTPGQSRHHAFDYAVEHLATCHELENYRALLRPLGVEPAALPMLRIPPACFASVAPLLAQPRRGPGSAGTILFHPWAGGAQARLKEWPVARWVSLAAALRARGYAICITGGQDDMAKAHHLVCQAAAQGVVVSSVAGQLKLTELAALLSGATAIVSVNTGIMHLAAAVGARLVALHGPTNPLRWGPLGAAERIAVLTPAGGTGGYLHLGFEFPKNAADIMQDISAGEVLAALLRLLQPARQVGWNTRAVAV